jgi:hypothetical protein
MQMPKDVEEFLGKFNLLWQQFIMQ